MTGHDALHYVSIDAAGRLIQDGKLSPVELTEAYLNRIDALDNRLHSYLCVTADSALSAARAAEKEIQKGDYRGPLHGIPIALKDLVDTEGVSTTYGCKAFKDRVPDRDATLAARLKAAGCILLGKLTMSELAMVGPPGFGEETRNPWNTEYAPGGSSSGSGVAVAAGLCAGSIGSDTGGSIRFPASNHSIVGLMPTYGRVSRCGVMPLSWTLDHLGPMTRTVEDAALMLSAIAGHDPGDRTTSTEPVPDFRAGLADNVKGLSVGILEDTFEDNHPDTQKTIEQAISAFESLGARTKAVRVPNYEVLHIANTIIYLVEGFNIYREVLRARPEDVGEVFRLYGYMGGLFTADEYVQAMRLRSRAKRDVQAIFADVDILLSPAISAPPGKIADFDPFILTHPTRSGVSEIFNLAACPALSMPCGFSADKLPIGLQLAAAPMDEQTLLSAAYTYQQHTGVPQQHPPI